MSGEAQEKAGWQNRDKTQTGHNDKTSHNLYVYVYVNDNVYVYVYVYVYVKLMTHSEA